MKKEINDIHAIAEAYLMQIGAKDIPAVVHGTRFKQVSYGETTQQFTKRIESEQEKRYEVTSLPDTFVLQHGKKFFYGFKDGVAKWTYERNLGYRFDHHHIETAIHDLESFGFAVTKLPVSNAQSSL